MRIVLFAASMAVVVAAQAQSPAEEAAFANAWREAYTQGCAEEAGKAVPDKDLTPTCACVAESYSKGKAREQLRVPVTPADLGPHEDQCLKSHPPRQK